MKKIATLFRYSARGTIKSPAVKIIHSLFPHFLTQKTELVLVNWYKYAIGCCTLYTMLYDCYNENGQCNKHSKFNRKNTRNQTIGVFFSKKQKIYTIR